MSINLSELARQVSLPLHLEDPEMAARVALEGLGQMDVKVGSKHDAFVILTSFLQALLDNDLYADAARLLWKASVFTAEPQSVQNIFQSLFDESQILVQGSASTGKSFSIGVWMYLDWRRDPANTNIQIVGPSEKHLEANLFSHLINLHNTSAIPAAGAVTSLCIALDPHNKYAGIKGVVIPLGKKSAGRLQGVKVKPRDVPHPRLGKMTRLRVVLEEAENIHVGIWDDLINLSANAANKQQFKVIAAYNPKDRSSPVGMRAEPLDGWGSVDIDTSHQWFTKRGWKLVRLDGLKTENVQLGWEKYPGLQTRAGLEALTLQAGGMNTAGYYCADVKTEVMTKRGWLKYDEVKIGDEAWTLNLKTGKSEWGPVQEIFSKHYEGALLSVEGRSLSALVTPNHRWPVTDKLRMKRGTGFAIKEAKDLSKNNLLPLVSPPAIPEHRDGSDPLFAALIGWIITDGSVSAGSGDVCVYQSETANLEKCEVIRGLVCALTDHYVERNHNGIIHFSLSGRLGKRVQQVLPTGKPFPWTWIAGLCRQELRAFLDAATLGDGGVQGGSTRYVCSKTKDHADGFVSVAAMLGIASTTHTRQMPPTTVNGYSYGSVEMHYVDFIGATETLKKNNPTTEVQYSGIVWCPRTPNSTWMCRREGHVHFTGNTMARGWYPEEGLDTVVIPPALLKDDQCRGEYVFMEEPENVMAVDSALEGGDNTVCMLGRFGRASGYKRLGTLDNLDGNTEVFRDSKGNRTYRSVLQVDQIVMLPKGRTEDVSQAILKVARGASVRPEWLGIDRTGNGAGVHDMIRSNFGDQVHGINGSTSSTEMRILSEDMKLPCDEYNLLYTELWFALKKWLEVGVLKFAFNVPSDPMFSELMGRRYLQPTGNPRVRVEPKAAYKSRGSKSPDRADALTMLLHVVRLQTSITQSFRVGSATETSGGRRMRQRIDITSTFDSLD